MTLIAALSVSRQCSVSWPISTHLLSACFMQTYHWTVDTRITTSNIGLLQIASAIYRQTAPRLETLVRTHKTNYDHRRCITLPHSRIVVQWSITNCRLRLIRASRSKVELIQLTLPHSNRTLAFASWSMNLQYMRQWQRKSMILR